MNELSLPPYVDIQHSFTHLPKHLYDVSVGNNVDSEQLFNGSTKIALQ